MNTNTNTNGDNNRKAKFNRRKFRSQAISVLLTIVMLLSLIPINSMSIQTTAPKNGMFVGEPTL
ncbi:MAG: hypothetical protein LBT12_03120, partial [Oscillospiraceae bacterium]|nr:hypothetical protein [Oscillospiraceae bacterium]